MIIKKLAKQKEIVALDDTRIREFLNPKHEKIGPSLTYSLAHASLPRGGSSLPHRFFEASEVYYILKGKGMMHIDDEVAEVESGDTIYIPPKAIQYIENIGEENLDFLCIVDPAWEPDAEELVIE
ncbi:MAG: cupin domain-containing protein [Candidatus Thorarchaeota archaeon]|nr:cupin domain-containing protein [Candidatus Thorarchaeota archaeon]